MTVPVSAPIIKLRVCPSLSKRMTSLGATFRREREARGVSLEEIAEETKIGIRLLRAIENEQFDRLPGGIFNKSFVRQYARYLGLDEETAIREYLQAVGSAREPAPSQRSAPLEPPVLSSGISYPRIIAAAVGLGVLVAGIAYGLYRLQAHWTAAPASRGEDSSKSISASTPPRPAPLPTEPQSAPSPVVPSPSLGAGPADFPAASSSSPAVASAPSIASVPSVLQPSGQAESSPPREGLQLRIDSRGPVWLSITADGAKQWQGTLRPNQTREVQATESVRLTVGDAGAVELTLNGKPLPPLGRSGEVKSITITAKGTPEPAP